MRKCSLVAHLQCLVKKLENIFYKAEERKRKGERGEKNSPANMVFRKQFKLQNRSKLSRLKTLWSLKTVKKGERGRNLRLD